MSDIAELFARDPLQLTDPDITRIVEEFRKSRHLFNLGGQVITKIKKPKPLDADLAALANDLKLEI